jgi:hypothetical protein
MKKRAIHAALIFAALAYGFASEALAQYCDFPPKTLAQGERREFIGLYENKAYQYSILIPKGLVGYDTMDPFYQRGFGIVVGTAPQTYIFVNGEPNSLEFARPEDAASDFLGYLHRRGNRVLSSKITTSSLGNLKAAFFVAEYTCPDAPGQFVTASLVAISPKHDTLYEVSLYAHKDRFDKDRAVFDSLVKSWKWAGR